MWTKKVKINSKEKLLEFLINTKQTKEDFEFYSSVIKDYPTFFLYKEEDNHWFCNTTDVHFEHIPEYYIDEI